MREGEENPQDTPCKHKIASICLNFVLFNVADKPSHKLWGQLLLLSVSSCTHRGHIKQKKGVLKQNYALSESLKGKLIL